MGGGVIAASYVTLLEDGIHRSFQPEAESLQMLGTVGYVLFLKVWMHEHGWGEGGTDQLATFNRQSLVARPFRVRRPSS